MKTSVLTRLRGDDGLGLVLVLGMGGILTALMIVSTTTALRSLESSRQHLNFENALAVADGGIEATLARTQTAYNGAAGDSYRTPAPGDATCDATVIAWPPAFNVTPPSAEQERNWAMGQLGPLAANPACRQEGPSGDYVVLKPAGRQTVYSLSFTPNYNAAERKSRLLKAEYLFTPYSPNHAILTSGSLTLDSSTTVTSAPPNATNLAAVHTNGSIIVSSGNPEVYGPVTQSASSPAADSNNFYANAGGDVSGKARQSIPFAGALSIWGENRNVTVPGGWYDLCTDGTARTRPTTAALGPCQGNVVGSATTSSSFRGWTFNGSGSVKTWSATSEVKQGQYSGTYYVHHGDVLNPASNSGAAVPNLTVIASASSTSCSKVGGNIAWGSTDPLAPSLDDTWLVADQDLLTSSSYQAGSANGGTVISGFFIAGDQINMSTSSNGAYGAVISADQCDPADGTTLVDFNQIKNPKIYYDPNAKAPFSDVINNTLWLEYPS